MDDLTNTATPDEQSYKPPVGGPAQAPQQQAQAPQPAEVAQANEEHHSVVGKIYHAVLGTLGGKNDVSYERDPNTGKLTETATPRSPGDQWKNIIAGALTGLAAGAGAKKANPGAPALTGAGMGFQAVQQKNAQADQGARDSADKEFDAQQKTTVLKAQLAKMNQDTTVSTWNLSRAKVDAGFQDQERENSFMKGISLDDSNRDLGVARNVDDLMQMHKDMPDLLNQQAHGNVMGIPHINSQGQLDGMHYALVTPEWKEKRVSQDQTLYRLMPSTKPGQPPQVDKQIVKAGTMTNGDFFAAQQAANGQFLSYYEKQQVQQGEDRRATAHEAGEDRRAQLAAQTKENVAATTAGRKDIVQHDKDYVKPANSTEESFKMMDSAYRDYKAAAAQGKSLPTGAQSMLALSQHLQTTFGQVKGARVTKDMIAHHLGARDITDDMEVAVNKLVNGDVLSPGQWDAFHNLVGEARKGKWETAVKEAKRKNIPIDFLPKDLEGMADAPEGADGEVTDKDGKVIGYMVKGKYQAK